MTVGAMTEPACAVIGLGFVGTSTFRLLARAGLRPYGYDVSAAALARARSELPLALDPAVLWSVGSGPEPLVDADVVMVAVRLGRDPDGVFHDEALRQVAETLNRHGRDGQLIILESTVQPGTTRRFAEQWLRRPGVDVAHAPERLRIGDDDARTLATPRLVAGLTPTAGQRAEAFLARIGLQPVRASAPEVTELSKLLENAFLTTNIALIGEITRLAHAAGVSAREVTAAAATKPHGYFAFHPGPGIGGHCLRNDLDLLRQHAYAHALSTPMLDGIAHVAAELPAMVVRRLEQRLAALDQQLRGTSVLLVGVGFKIGSPDLTETPAIPIVRALRQAGAKPAYADSIVPVFEVDGDPVPRCTIERQGSRRFGAALVLAGDRAIAAPDLRASCTCILDAGGGVITEGGFAVEERL